MPTPSDVAGCLAALALVVGFYAVVLHYANGILDGRICPRCLRSTLRGSHDRCKPRNDRERSKPPADPEW